MSRDGGSGPGPRSSLLPPAEGLERILGEALEALAGGTAAQIQSLRNEFGSSGSELELALRGILLRTAADPRRLEARGRGSRVGAAPTKAALDLSAIEDADSLRAALASRLPLYLSGLFADELLPSLDLDLAELVADASAAMGGERAAPLSKPVESRRDSSRAGLDRLAREYDTLGREGGMPIPSELSKLSAAEFFPAPPRRSRGRAPADAIEGYAREPFADDLALYGIYEYVTGRMLKFAAEKSARLTGIASALFVIEEPLWDCRARSVARAIPPLLARFAALGNRNIDALRLEVLRGNAEDGFRRFRYDLPARSLAADPGFFFREETLPYFSRAGRPEAAPRIPPLEDYILVRTAGRPGLPRGPAGRPEPDALAAGERCIARVVLSGERAELYFEPAGKPSFEGVVLAGAGLGFTPDRGRSLEPGFEDLLLHLRARVSNAARA
jgi:hypothetical protein